MKYRGHERKKRSEGRDNSEKVEGEQRKTCRQGEREREREKRERERKRERTKVELREI